MRVLDVHKQNDQEDDIEGTKDRDDNMQDLVIGQVCGLLSSKKDKEILSPYGDNKPPAGEGLE